MEFISEVASSDSARNLLATKNPFSHDKPEDSSCDLTPFGCLNGFWCNPAFGLADAGYNYCFVQSAYGELAVVPTTQLAWLNSHGTDGELLGSRVCQWFAFSLCIVILVFYAYHSWKATTGWEEVYVCIVELVKVTIEIYHEFDSPASLYLSTGNWALWLRYGEWLLTCPVILIHLSNITGLKDDYSKRTMRLLVSDIGCVVWGITAALCTGYLKWIFFSLGLVYGCNTYFHSAKVYMEAYHTVPKGHCRLVVRLMAYSFFSAWTMYPVLFVLGPEGLAHMSGYTSTITTTIADCLAKQLWGLLGHHLRVKIFEHILIHGDIRKKTKMQIGGEEIDVEELVDEEGEDTIKHSTKELANRASFIVMGDALKAKGIDLRMSMDPNGSSGGGGQADNGGLEPGRVILSVPDMSMIDFFKAQFAGLPAPIELVPALGGDNTLQLVQQASALGGCDCVLLHPEFLKDTSPNGLLGRLRMMGQRVCAFGWTPVGPARDLIESRGLDGWIEGPSFGTGIDRSALIQLVASMQMMRRNNMMGGMGGMPMATKQMPPAFSYQQSISNSATPLLNGEQSGRPSFIIRAADQGNMYTPNPMMNHQASMSHNVAGVNPLFGSPPSPLQSQVGSAAPAALNSSLYGNGAPAHTSGNVTPPSPNGRGANVSEAEMLQQLMGEITRLKSELGVTPPPHS